MGAGAAGAGAGAAGAGAQTGSKRAAGAPPRAERARRVTVPTLEHRCEPAGSVEPKSAMLVQAGDVVLVDAAGAPWYEVESLRAMRQPAGAVEREFLVRWRGYSPADDSWEAEVNIDESLVQAFANEAAAANGAVAAAAAGCSRTPGLLVSPLVGSLAEEGEEGGEGEGEEAPQEGEALVSRRIVVWWEGERRWFAGEVDAYDSHAGPPS